MDASRPRSWISPASFRLRPSVAARPGFQDVVVAIVSRHVGQGSPEMVKSRPSRDGNYLSVTVLLMALSREQLDAIYRDLSDCEQVLMAL